MFEPLDERLIHALQINPRAPWSALAAVVGADAVTLSRRWERLVSAGEAWVTGYFTAPQGALIDISCVPQRVDEVVQALGAIPELITIDHTTGGRDIIATAMMHSTAHLWDVVTHKIGALDGVRQAQSHLVTEVIMDASSWRLRALSPGEQARVPGPKPPRPRAPRTVHPDVEAALRAELPQDGRVPVSVIAQRHGLSEQRVADGLARALEQDLLRVRTDISRARTPSPIYAWYYMNTPAALIPNLRRLLERVPEARTAMAAASQYNLVMAVWLRQLSDVSRFEAAMEAALPGARIMDRSVVVTMSKHMGQLLDDDGRATRGFINPFRHPAEA
ncbi:MAG: Lrp/AsnC family transcriptional regulator [Arthrobacter sp.]|nr:Lrp/AsnC family transcriptional regulator [Arthrobacter sp.]